MATQELTDKLIAAASRVFNKDASAITAETNIAEELGSKSLDRMGMCAVIENEFDVVIPFAEFGMYKTIGELADFIASEAE